MEQHAYEVMYRVEENHWWYVGRRNLILDQIAQFYEGTQGLRLLDIGCGTGIFIQFLKRYGHVVGLDFSTDALDFCRQRGCSELVRGDGSILPFGANTFDLLTANDLVEHLDDDLAALREFLRVLKPGGRVFLFVPAFQFLWSLQDEVAHHRRRYTSAEMRLVLKKAGFQVVKVTYANALLFPLIYVGRQMLKIMRRFRDYTTENDLHPGWANRPLTAMLNLEVPMLRKMRFPFGVSIIAVAEKP